MTMYVPVFGVKLENKRKDVVIHERKNCETHYRGEGLLSLAGFVPVSIDVSITSLKSLY
jgi:hypothetical protein